jgi:hypothetical protein
LAKALQNPCPNSPLHPLADNELHKLHELQTILHNRAAPTPTTTPPTAPPTDPKVSFSQSLTTDILPPNARTLRRRRERVAKQKPPETNHPKDSIAARVRRQPRPPTTAHKAKAARATRSNSAANRKARSKRSLHAAIILNNLRTDRLEQLLHPRDQPSHWHTPQACNAINIDTGREASYQELRRNSEGEEWAQMMSDEIGKCAQGNDAHPDSGTNTFFFITKAQVPSNKSATYARIVPEDRPHKEIKKRIRLTVGGNRIEYNGPVATKNL